MEEINNIGLPALLGKLLKSLRIVVLGYVEVFLMSDVNELLNIAIKETENMKQREGFLVRDLFKGYEWNRISRSQRLLSVHYF